MKKLWSIFWLLAITHSMFAAQVTGKVIDSGTKQPIDFATVSVLKAGANDATPVTGAITDDNGDWSLDIGDCKIKVYGVEPKAGVISFNVYSSRESRGERREELIHPFDIGTLLDQQGVAVRTGHHCAEPLIDEIGVPGTVRVSFGLYNDKSDVDAFIAALKKAIQMLM